MPLGAATAWRTIQIDEQMSQLASGAVRATQETAVDHDGPSDARRDRHVHEVARPRRSANRCLCKGGGLGIAIEDGREPDRLLDARGKIDVPESRPEVRWIDDPAGPWVNRPRR